MASQAVQWSERKNGDLRNQLIGFWSDDVWNMNKCPLVPEGTTGLDRIRFTCKSQFLNSELKYACWQKLIRGEWGPQSHRHAPLIHRLIRWLNGTGDHVQSLVEHRLGNLELSFHTYLKENKYVVGEVRPKLSASQQMRHYQLYGGLTVLRQLYHVIEEAYDRRPEYEKDIWDLRRLGVPTSQSRAKYALNFTRLVQPWLSQAAKAYVRYTLSHNAAENASNKLLTLQDFSQFLYCHHPQIQATGVDRKIIVEYLAYLLSSGLHARTRAYRIAHLRQFFELCAREGWAAVPDKVLFYKEDLPRHNIALQPRFIPQEVLAQLNRQLSDADIPVYFRRMMLILQECGMRAGELLTMPFDCLMQDAEGDWWVRFYIHKMKKEHSLPIPSSLAAEIQKQQQDVRSQWGDQAPILFPGPRGKPYHQSHISEQLHNLAYKHKICDTTGKQWRFTLHQFRHSLGTQMINNGVPHHIVQKVLGHETPVMTNTYAHVFDTTKKQEFEKYRKAVGPIIDIKGRVRDLNSRVDTAEHQLLKQFIDDRKQALPNGHCTLPVAQGPCPHYNACLQCTWFVTDGRYLPIHEAQLVETEQELVKAYQISSVRQIHKLEADKASLVTIIASITEHQKALDDTQAKP